MTQAMACEEPRHLRAAPRVNCWTGSPDTAKGGASPRRVGAPFLFDITLLIIIIRITDDIDYNNSLAVDCCCILILSNSYFLSECVCL